MPAGETSVRVVAPLALAIALAALAASGATWRTTAPGTVAVLVDGSGSVAPGERERAARIVEGALAASSQRAREVRLGFAGETWLGGPEGSAAWTDPGRAIDDAADLVLASGGGGVVLATDGADPPAGAAAAARRARARGVPVDVLPLGAAAGDGLSVETLEVPATVPPGAPFAARVLVRSAVPREVRVALEIDGRSVGALAGEVSAHGLHAFGFLLRAPDRPFVLTAVASAEGAAASAVERTRVAVEGRLRVAVIGDGPPRIAGAEAFRRVPARGELARFDAVWVAAGRGRVPDAAEQERLARYAREGGGVALSVADVDVAAALRGGALEPVLPARLRRPPDETEAAVVLLVDRSGSMDRSEAPGADAELSLAVGAARAVAALLEADDRLGVIAFDVAAHPIRPLSRVGSAPLAAAGLPGLAAAGGTDWAPALDLALGWLSGERAARRHLVLISDGRLAPGADGRPSGPWPDGVTLSTVSLGARADRTGMARMARERGGRHDHVDDPRDLPAALRREIAALAPADVRRGPLALRPAPDWAGLLAGARIGKGRGVLVIDPREGAEVALRTERGDAVLCFASAGWGRSALLATDPGALAGTGIAESALGRVAAPAAGDASWRVRRRGPWIDVEIVDPSPAAPRVAVRLPAGGTRELEPEPAGVGRWRASVPVTEAGEYLVEWEDRRRRVSIETAPEASFLPQSPDWAASLAAAGGGRVLDARAGLSASRRERVRDLAPGLLALAALLFFADAALGERRGRLRARIGDPRKPTERGTP